MLAPVQPNEVATLTVGIVCALVLLCSLRASSLPGAAPFLAGFAAVLAAQVFTVAEGFRWATALNLLEHACLAAAGIVFAAAVWRSARRGPPGGA